MTTFQALVIGVVQGLTEFLPISSTAHMKIVPVLLGWDDPGSGFSAVIQIGTLLAVIVYFWRDLWRIARAMLSEAIVGKLAATHDSRTGWMIMLGTIPIVVLGLLFEDQIDTTLRSLYVMSAALAGVAVLLAIAEWFVRNRPDHGRNMQQLNWRDATVVGLAQAAALVPGTSRSGATLLGGLASGLNRETAARYSFLLSVPAVFAAGVYKLIKEREDLMGSYDETINLLVGLVAAAVVGYLSIDWLLRYLRKRSTFVFIVYRIGLAIVLIFLLQSDQIDDELSAATTATRAARHSITE